MKKSWLLLSATAVVGAIVAISSCTKVEEEVKNTTATAEDITRTESYLANIFNIADDVANSDSSLKKGGSTLLPPGAEFKITDASLTDGDDLEYYVDFGAAPGLLCNDGITRAGKIEFKQSKLFNTVGCVLVVDIPTKNNFMLGTPGHMVSVSGMATVTRKTTNKVNFVITNGKASEGSAWQITFSSDKDIVHEELGQPGIADDVFKGFGSGSGTNSNGKPYTWTTKDSLVKKEEPNCTFPVKGIIELTSEKSTYKIDFSPDSAACDKKVVITLPNGTKIPKTFN